MKRQEVRLSDDLHARIKELAQRNGRSVPKEIERAIDFYLSCSHSPTGTFAVWQPNERRPV